jgi:hypothetical protein
VPFWHELRGLVWLFFFSSDSTMMMVEAGPVWSSARRKLWLLCPKGVFIRILLLYCTLYGLTIQWQPIHGSRARLLQISRYR